MSLELSWCYPFVMTGGTIGGALPLPLPIPAHPIALSSANIAAIASTSFLFIEPLPKDYVLHTLGDSWLMHSIQTLALPR
jgi:hypothetical protein